MTIIEAVSRMARHHTRRDYSALTAPELADAVLALNTGMQELYQKLSPEYRQKPVSVLVPAPRVVTISATYGSKALGSAVFTEEEVGRSVMTSADTVRHRAGGVAALADAWLGTTGDHDVTVYGDAVAGDDFPFERMVGAPAILVGEGRERVLVPHQPEPTDMWAGSLGGVGEPRAYWLESQGNSQGVEPIVVMRLLPLPDRAYRLRYVASLAPRRIRFPDVETGAPLPVPDNFADALIPLALLNLVGVPGWAVDAAAAREAYARAMRFVEMSRVRLDPAPRRVGTPVGY